MKFGIVISVQKTQFPAVSYTDDLEENIRMAGELGYDGVELAIRDPGALDVKAMKALVMDKYHLEIPAIGTGQAYIGEGLSFTDNEIEIRKKAIERIKSHIDLGTLLNASVIIGLIRGRGNDEKVTKQKKQHWLDTAIESCATYAGEKKVTLFIEPLCRYETSLLNTVDDTIELIKRVSMKNIKILIDTFHMNIEEPSIYGSIVKSIHHLGHVHFADSNRHAPGRGHLDFMGIINILSESGYNGYVSMEMLPLPTINKAAKMAIRYLKEILCNRK